VGSGGPCDSFGLSRGVLKMPWLINSPCFWLLAVLCSLFWGIYGLNVHEEKGKCRCIINFGVFLSEFLGSMGGWISLSVLIFRLKNYGNELGVFDATLVIVAIGGIIGFSYKIGEALSKKI